MSRASRSTAKAGVVRDRRAHGQQKETHLGQAQLSLSLSCLSAARLNLFIPDDVLLCIIDNLVSASPDPDDQQAVQKTHNSLSLVSKGVLSLVRRVRYKHLYIRPAVESYPKPTAHCYPQR